MNAKNPTWFILFLVCCSLLTAADTAGPRKKRADPTKQPPAASAATAPVAPVPPAAPILTPPAEVQPPRPGSSITARRISSSSKPRS